MKVRARVLVQLFMLIALMYAVGNLIFVFTGNQAVAIVTAPVIVFGALGYAFMQGWV